MGGCMSVTHDDVLRAAMQLPEGERMLLAEELIESVPEDDTDSGVPQAELLSVLTRDHLDLWARESTSGLGAGLPDWHIRRDHD